MATRTVVRRAIAPTLLLLLFARCDDLPTESEAGDGIWFTVRETLAYGGVGEPEITLSLRTEKLYACALLLAEVRLDDGVITATIDGVNSEIFCLAVVGLRPAGFATPLPLEPGEYALIVRQGVALDTYQITVTPARIDVAGGLARWVSPEVRRSWRVPRPSLAFLCDPGQGRAVACAALRAEIEGAVDIDPAVFPPGGARPYTDLWHAEQGWNTTIYRYDAEETFEAAGAAFRSALPRYPGIAAVLVNWRNEWIESWAVLAAEPEAVTI